MEPTLADLLRKFAANLRGSISTPTVTVGRPKLTPPKVSAPSAYMSANAPPMPKPQSVTPNPTASWMPEKP